MTGDMLASVQGKVLTGLADVASQIMSCHSQDFIWSQNGIMQYCMYGGITIWLQPQRVLWHAKLCNDAYLE